MWLSRYQGARRCAARTHRDRSRSGCRQRLAPSATPLAPVVLARMSLRATPDRISAVAPLLPSAETVEARRGRPASWVISLDVRRDRRYGLGVRYRSWLVAIIVVIAILGVLRYRTSSDPSGARAAAPHGGAGAVAAATSTAASPVGSAKSPPPAHVTRLANPAQRQVIADRIAASRADRARQAPPRPPSLPGGADDSHDLERAAPRLKVALAEAIPFLAECYKTGPTDQAGKPRDRRPAVLLTLIGDPDVGTLIDADQLMDPDGKPLDAELEGCLRTTLGSLELPPLDATSDLHLKYSFVLDD